jgi:hypothetical protein
MVKGLGCRVKGLRSRVLPGFGTVLPKPAIEFRAEASKHLYRVESLGLRVPSLRFRM